MKKIVFILTLLLLIGCKSKNGVAKSEASKTTKVAITEINETQKSKVTAIGKQILMTCNTSKFKPLTEKEATLEVRKNMTIERLTKTCLKFRLKYGDFVDLKFVEAHRIKKQNTTIYRYKSTKGKSFSSYK